MRLLSTLISTLCLTIALGAPTVVFANVSTPSTIPPAEAPVQAPNCITVDVFTRDVLSGNPGVEIKEVDPASSSITFTHPDYPTDLKAGFDEKGCLFVTVEIPKEPKVGV